jgi:exosortase
MKATYSIEQIKAVILVGGHDFGRCPVASRLNRALWPIIDKPALQYMIEGIFRQGVRRFVVCYGGSAQELQNAVNLPDGVEVEYQTERLPRGTAGCLKDALSPEKDEILVVFQSMFVPVPDIAKLMAEHHKGDGGITLFFYPESNGGALADAAPVYVCEPSIVNYVPATGYFDLKEGLVPALVRADKKIGAASFNQPAASFRDWREYVNVILDYAQNNQGSNMICQTAEVAPSARLTGTVVIGHHVRVGDNAVLIGPVVLGQDCSVGAGAFISESVVWQGAQIGTRCLVEGALVDAGKAVKAGSSCRGSVLACSPGWYGPIKNRLTCLINRFSAMTSEPKNTIADCLDTRVGKAAIAIGCLALLCGVAALYWIPTLRGLARIWTSSDEYSSGMLAPLLAGVILWIRRKQLSDCPVRPAIWLGLAFVLFAQGVRFFGLYYMFSSLDNISLILTITGLIVMVFGLGLTLRLWSVLAFLCLMLPFPKRVQNFIALPLQEWATVSAVFVLETFGFNVIREGNVINLNGTMVAVAEACNGLRMLTAFIMVCALVVLAMRRTFLEKALLLLSCIPIALLCNTLRLAITSIAFTFLSSAKWEKVFHDYGGLAMMPVAMLLIVGQLWLFRRLFYQAPPSPRAALAALEIVYRKEKE